jgi:hypothetical protein
MADKICANDSVKRKEKLQSQNLLQTHTEVVKVRKHQRNMGCVTPRMTQIIVNCAKFTTALTLS